MKCYNIYSFLLTWLIEESDVQNVTYKVSWFNLHKFIDFHLNISIFLLIPNKVIGW
jgi:hypothetical protein